MRYLVTGAGGFVGSHISDRLIAEGKTVVGIDNFTTGHPRNLHDAARVVRGDIAEWHVVDRAFGLADPDVVFHCAASYKDPEAWATDIRTNVLGTSHVVKLAEQYGARIIYFQTALCYGHRPFEGHDPLQVLGHAIPIDDITWPPPVRVDHPIAPDNSYSISKTAGESYIASSGLPYVSIRMANVYGPRNLSGPIPTFSKNLLEGRRSVISDSRRDFIFVADLLDLVWQILDSDYVGVLHASSGTDYPISDIYDAVEAALGITGEAQRIPRAEGDAPSILLDPTLTEARFGWKVTTPLAEGIAQAAEFYSEHGVETTYTHLPIATTG